MFKPRWWQVPVSDATFEPAHPQRIHLGPGRHAIFGYGSLLSMPSVERTLGHPYGGPFVVCGLEGWRRCWDVAMPNRTFFTRIGDESVFPREILYLNIRRAPEETMTGVVFVVSDDELAAYDRRESVYDRVAVADALRGVTVEDGEAWTYIGRARVHPARRHVMAGCRRPRLLSRHRQFWADRAWTRHARPIRAVHQSGTPAPDLCG